MAIQWGATSGYEQVGVDVRHGAVGASTTSLTVYVDYYVRSAGYGFSDAQTLTAYGALSRAWNFTFSAPANSWTEVLVGTLSFTASLSYSGGPTYSFGAVVSGSFNGGTPRLERSFTLPARQTTVPNHPGSPTFSNITSNKIRVTSPVPNNNGLPILEWQFRQANDSAFTSGFKEYNHTSNVLDIGGLAKASTYWFGVRCRNAKGWSAFGTPYRSAKTLATVPDTMAKPVLVDVGPDTATVTYKAPDNGGSAITSYQVMVAQKGTTGSIKRDGNLVGLKPGVIYDVQVRAVNAIGGGAWSPPVTFETLSGAAVKVAGTWRTAKVWVKVAGTWRAAKVHKKAGGTWRL